MIYETIQPPFTLKFREMKKQELKEYSQWFHAIIPERMQILETAVKTTSGYEAWRMDCTPASLDILGEWLANHVEKRRRTEEEIQEIQARSRYPIPIPDSELTNRTFSLAIDVGMYLSLIFLKNFPGLQWIQPFGGKTSIDYGQPVLSGFGVKNFNPVHMAVTLTYGLANKTKTGTRLRELYDIWANMVDPQIERQPASAR